MEVDNLVASTRNLVDDLENFRLFWESNKQWEARKKLLCHNWEKYDNKEKLVSLSCAWSNVNFMGNTYSSTVMAELKVIENGLFPEEQEEVITEEKLGECNANVPVLYDTTKLPKHFSKVSFVKSSDFNINLSIEDPLRKQNYSTSIVKPKHYSDHEDSCENQDKTNQNSNVAGNFHELSDKFRDSLSLQNNDSLSKSTSSTISSSVSLISLTETLVKFSNKLKLITITQNTPGSVLLSSVTDIANELFVKVKFSCEIVTKKYVSLYNFWAKRHSLNEFKNCSWVCDLYVDTIFVCQEYGRTKAKSKNKAVKSAIQLLTGPFFVTSASRLVSKTESIQQCVAQTVSSTNEYPPLLSVHRVPIFKPAADNTSKLKPYKNVQEKSSFVKDSQIRSEKKETFNSVKKATSANEVGSAKMQKKLLKNNALTKEVQSNLSKPKSARFPNRSCANVSPSLDYSFIIVLVPTQTAINILRTSASRSEASLQIREGINGIESECTIALNSFDIATCTGPSRAIALENAADRALNILKKKHPVLIQTRQIGNLDNALNFDSDVANQFVGAEAIPESNIGNQLLRKMGWTGSGGLGVAKTGISEPIATESSSKESWDRSGLGHKKGLFTRKTKDPGAIHKTEKIVPFHLAKKAMIEYIRNGCVEELTFPPDLTKNERKDLHFLAKRMGLNSKSFGTVDRYIVVYKKFSVFEMAKQLSQTGGELNGYILAAP